MFIFFFKQKTAYEMRISDWSSACALPILDATVTLSYLARGFDWSADYVATLGADGSTLDLGAWVTLANGNGTGFPQASTTVVAGRLNKIGRASCRERVCQYV